MKKVLFISLAAILALSVGLIGCGGDGACEPPTDKIYIYASRSLSGGLEEVGDYAFAPVMAYWLANINAAGGIDVGGAIGKKLVDLTIVDDTSDIGIMTTNLAGAIGSCDYHYVFPPISTAFLQAAAGICSGLEYVLLGTEGGCTTIQDTLTSYPYLFGTLSFSTWGQMDALFPILRDWQENDGAPTPMKAYVIYIDDLHGYEYVGAFNATAATYPGKFDIVGTAAVAPGTATVLTQLQQAESLNATLLCSFTYPPTSFAVVWDAVDADINFDAMLVGPGMNFEIMLLPRGPLSPGIGAENAHGMMGFAGWNEEIGGNVTADFAADYSAFFTDPLGPPGNGRFALDWWGSLSYYAGLECFVQGIERAGTLNNADLRAELAAAGHTTAKFDTVMGDVWFTNAAGAAPGTGGGLMAKACWPGHIGQWQFDVGLNWTIYEIIDIGTGTADGIYPKPDWP